MNLKIKESLKTCFMASQSTGNLKNNFYISALWVGRVLEFCMSNIKGFVSEFAWVCFRWKFA